MAIDGNMPLEDEPLDLASCLPGILIHQKLVQTVVSTVWLVLLS
jgi:hypothetical protein